MNEARSVAAMGDYYAQRADYYERVYFRPERQHDLRVMEAWLASRFAGRRVLEIACGTGWWTPHGARRASDWLATDLNPETIELACRKPLPSCVRFEIVDAFTLAGSASAASTAPSPAAGGATCRSSGSHVGSTRCTHASTRVPGW